MFCSFNPVVGMVGSLSTAIPWAGKGDRENKIHLDEVHDLLIALVKKILNFNQGLGSFGLHCIS